MKLGIMQPYFFPYIGYWQLINEVDTYVIYDDVNYIKGGWINRNRILINGKPSYYNVQLKDASPFKKINEIEISNDDRTKRKMLATLQMAYKKAPYFNDVYPILEEIINQDENNLAKYLEFSIKKICEYLGINTKIIISSDIKKNNDLKKTDKVIHICKILGASEYINAVGGQEMYDYDTFAENGIELKFMDTNKVKYNQFGNEFEPNLSIIDVMMFNSKEELKKIMNDYDLISNKVKKI